MSEHTPTPVEIPQMPSRAWGRPPTPHHGVDIRRISVPVLLVIAAGAAFATVMGTWTHIDDHTKNQIIHLNEQRVLNEGLPVHKQQLDALRADIQNGFRSSRKDARKLMMATQWKCRAAPGGGFTCRPELPEDNE